MPHSGSSLLALVVFSLQLAIPVATATAATFVVDTSIDDVDIAPGDGLCADVFGECTLRAAIMEANALPGPDTVRLITDVDLTIPDPTGDSDEVDDSAGDLDVTDDLTIAGDDDYLPIIRGPGVFQYRIFHVVSSTHLKIFSVIIERGNAFGGNLHPERGGGGIRNEEGVVSLFGVTLRENRGDPSAFYNGGIIGLIDSTVEFNAGTGGPGIDTTILNFGELRIVRSKITDNVNNHAAGLSNDWLSNHGRVVIVDSMIARNRSIDTGTVWNTGDMTIIRTTISDNETLLGGAGIQNGGSLRLINSTISGNRAGVLGGVTNSSTGVLWIVHSTITGNMDGGGGGGIANSGVAFVQSSIIAGNVSDPEFGPTDCLGTFTSLGNNIIGDGAFCSGFDHPTDRVGTAAAPIDPMLGPLSDNGGHTLTHALLPGSPAINAIHPSDCVYDHDGDPSTKERPLRRDQRMMPRRVGGGCDVGSFEYIKAKKKGRKDKKTKMKAKKDAT